MLKQLVLVIGFCLSASAYATAPEQAGVQLLLEICRTLQKQNDDFLLREQLGDDVFLVEDPVQGEQLIMYKEKNNRKIPGYFSRLDTPQQMALLRTERLPVFPLADTLLLVDTFRFFPEGWSYKVGKTLFKVVRNTTVQSADTGIMYVFLLGNMQRNRNGYRFMIFFSFAKPGYEACIAEYYFTVDSGTYKMAHTSLDCGGRCEGG